MDTDYGVFDAGTIGQGLNHIAFVIVQVSAPYKKKDRQDI